MYDGIVVVKKEKGFTSFDVVAKLRGIFGQRKIGHTGTLDPDAEGVLVVCLGSATKVCGLLSDRDKEYEAVLLLGKETDTQDISGIVLSERPVNVSGQEVRKAVSRFQGELLQVPPMYSALKVDGKKLCDLARAGKEVERKARSIVVYKNEILFLELPRVKLRISCSKGTYIRTLCHEIGRDLGCGGCMESLVRTKASGFSLAQAHTVGELQAAGERGALDALIIPVDAVFADLPAVTVKREADRFLYNGNPLRPQELETRTGVGAKSPVRVYDSAGRFCAVYQYQSDRECYRPKKMFLPQEQIQR